MVDPLALTSNILLFVLVFGMSATVDIGCMQEQIRNKKAIAAGIVCQFIVLPLLGFLSVNALDLDPDMGITLLVVTSSPGGSYSNWYVNRGRVHCGLSLRSVLNVALLFLVTGFARSSMPISP